MGPLLAFIVGAVVILLVEILVWMLFRRKASVLLFPRDMDASHLRLLTIGTLGIGTMMHTILFVIVFGIAIFNVW